MIHAHGPSSFYTTEEQIHELFSKSGTITFLCGRATVADVKNVQVR